MELLLQIKPSFHHAMRAAPYSRWLTRKKPH
jgi:hypothetical protein